MVKQKDVGSSGDRAGPHKHAPEAGSVGDPLGIPTGSVPKKRDPGLNEVFLIVKTHTLGGIRRMRIPFYKFKKGKVMYHSLSPCVPTHSYLEFYTGLKCSCPAAVPGGHRYWNSWYLEFYAGLEC